MFHIEWINSAAQRVTTPADEDVVVFLTSYVTFRWQMLRSKGGLDFHMIVELCVLMLQRIECAAKTHPPNVAVESSSPIQCFVFN